MGVNASIKCATRSRFFEPVGRNAERTAVGGMWRARRSPVRISGREPGCNLGRPGREPPDTAAMSQWKPAIGPVRTGSPRSCAASSSAVAPAPTSAASTEPADVPTMTSAICANPSVPDA